MKRIFAIVLVLCLMTTLVPVPVHAATVVASGEWSVGSTQWKVTSDGTLTLTGTGYIQGSNDPDNYPWRAYADEIRKIVVAGELTTICNDAFYNLTKVTSVVIGDTVTKIGDRAFWGCTSLAQITIPAGVTEIGEEAFMKCKSLPTVTFAENSQLTTLGNGAFAYSGLTSQVIPSGITEVGASVFYECKKLTSVILPEGLENIAGNAFYYCENLATLRLPSTLTWFSREAFRQCLGLKHLELYNMIDVAQYFPESGKLSSITVLGNPETVSGFRNCKSLRKVTLPDSIKRIEDSTFRFCTSLTSIDWPAAVEYVGDLAFAQAGFVEIILPDTVTEIGPNAFRGDNLVSFICGSGLRSISGQAFEASPNLTTVDLGNVETIEAFAFNQCTGLQTIFWSDELTTIDMSAFENCDALKQVVIPSSVTFIGSLAFAGIDQIEIRFEGDAPYFDAGCFSGTTGIAYYPSGNDTWTEEVMQNCEGNITWIPDNHVHDFEEMSVAPTCTQQGYTTQACTSCGKMKDPYNYVDALGHDMGLWQWDGSGTDHRDCSRCGYTETRASEPVVPETPVLKVSNVASTGKIKLSWDKADYAVKYQVYRATSKNGTYTLLKTVSGTSLTHSSAEAGKTYCYKIRAVSADGSKSDFSNIVSRTCDLARPVVTLTNIASSGKIKLTWTAVEGARKFEVYRSTDKENWTRLITTTGTSLTNSSAEAGVLYYYKVKAIAETAAADSAYSAVKSRRCDLPRPTVTLSNVASTGKIKISWKPVEGAVKYQVYRSTDNKNWTRLITTTGTSLTNSSAEAGVLYYYKVRAIASNSEANSAYSSVKSRTCDLPCPVLTVALNSKGKPSLSWGAVAGAVKYQVYYSTDGEAWTRLISTTGTKLTHSSAASGATYYYKVYAVASASSANSAYSAVDFITAG